MPREQVPGEAGGIVLATSGAGAGWLELTAPEELGEKAGAGFLGVARAALRLRDSGHDLVDVLAAAGPGGLATFSAGDLSAHGGSPFGGGSTV